MLRAPRSATCVLVWLICAPLAAGAPRVVLDPGHGGPQEGARGPGGVVEKDVALQIALELKRLLEKTGAQVVLTREADVPLSLPDRVAVANQLRPDLFISIHANSMPTRGLRARVEGIETFFLSASASGEGARATADRENAEAPGAMAAAPRDTLAFILADLARTEAHADSSRLAYAVHQRLIQKTAAVDRGVQQAPFFVLTGMESPAILVEVGFISHPREAARLRSAVYRRKVAQAIAEGVQAFLREVAGRDGRGTAVARPAGR